MVPNGWMLQNLTSLISIKHGFAFKSEYFSDKGKFILLTPGSFYEAGGFRDQGEKTKYYIGDIPAGYLLAKGNLLIAMTEQAVGLLGSTLFVPENNMYLHNQRLGLIQIKESNKITLEFLYLFFNNPTIRKKITEQSTGTKVKHTSPDRLCGVIGLIPPIEEQQKIAEILSTWDKAITITENLIANSQLQKKSLMQQLLTGKKRLLDENDVRFSEEWEKVPLSSKIIFSNLKSTKKNEYPIITSSRKGIFLQEDYFKKQVASENNIGYKVVPRDYITYRSMSDDGIFVFNKQTILDTAIISPAYGVFKFINLDASFGLYTMNSKHMMGKINTFSQGGTRIALKTSVLSNIKIHIPSLLEQKKIAEVISNADREIELLQAKLEHLKQEKKALMQQLLTGKRRVKTDN